MMIGRGQSLAAGSVDPEEPPADAELFVQTATPPGYLVGSVGGLPSGATVTMERVDADDATERFTYANGNIYTSLRATNNAVSASHGVTLTIDDAGTVTTRTLTIGVVAAGVIRAFPISQSINFGGKTLRGFGGHHLNYLGSAPLLRVVSQVNSSAASVNVWEIRQNKLTLSTTGSSYGAAPPTLSAGPYTVVVTDETITTTVTITIVANEFHIAPDTADTLTTSQFASTINGGSVAYGDQIIFRPGLFFRQGGSQVRFTATPRYIFQKTATFTGTPPASVSDANWVTCRAEVKNTQASYARFYIDFGAGTNPLYMQFHELNWRCIGNNPLTNGSGTAWESEACIETTCSGGITNPARWYMFTKCVFSVDNYVFADGTVESGQNTRSGRSAMKHITGSHQHVWYLDNLIYNVANGISSYGFGDVHIVGNELRACTNNEILFMSVERVGVSVGWSSVSWNYGWDVRRPIRQANPTTGAIDGSPHIDHWQAAYSSTAGVDLETNINCVGNIWSTLALSKVSQGHIQTPTATGLATDPGNVLWGKINAYGNMYFDGYGNGLGFENSENGVCKWNAVLTPPDLFGTDTLPSINHSGGAISRVTRFDSTKNITAGSCASSRGAGVASDNLTFIGTASNAPASKTEMLTIFAGPTFGANLITKQAHIDALTTVGAGIGYGPVGVGCDHIAQTATFPDGFTYARPYALIG